jgi:hypothetical protein
MWGQGNVGSTHCICLLLFCWRGLLLCRCSWYMATLQGDAVEIVVIYKDGTGDTWVPKVDREVLELKKD